MISEKADLKNKLLHTGFFKEINKEFQLVDDSNDPELWWDLLLIGTDFVISWNGWGCPDIDCWNRIESLESEKLGIEPKLYTFNEIFENISSELQEGLIYYIDLFSEF